MARTAFESEPPMLSREIDGAIGDLPRQHAPAAEGDGLKRRRRSAQLRRERRQSEQTLMSSVSQRLSLLMERRRDLAAVAEEELSDARDEEGPRMTGTQVAVPSERLLEASKQSGGSRRARLEMWIGGNAYAADDPNSQKSRGDEDRDSETSSNVSVEDEWADSSSSSSLSIFGAALHRANLDRKNASSLSRLSSPCPSLLDHAARGSGSSNDGSHQAARGSSSSNDGSHQAARGSGSSNDASHPGASRRRPSILEVIRQRKNAEGNEFWLEDTIEEHVEWEATQQDPITDLFALASSTFSSLTSGLSP